MLANALLPLPKLRRRRRSARRSSVFGNALGGAIANAQQPAQNAFMQGPAPSNNFETSGGLFPFGVSDQGGEDDSAGSGSDIVPSVERSAADTGTSQAYAFGTYPASVPGTPPEGQSAVEPNLVSPVYSLNTPQQDAYSYLPDVPETGPSGDDGGGDPDVQLPTLGPRLELPDLDNAEDPAASAEFQRRTLELGAYQNQVDGMRQQGADVSQAQGIIDQMRDQLAQDYSGFAGSSSSDDSTDTSSTSGPNGAGDGSAASTSDASDQNGVGNGSFSWPLITGGGIGLGTSDYSVDTPKPTDFVTFAPSLLQQPPEPTRLSAPVIGVARWTTGPNLPSQQSWQLPYNASYSLEPPASSISNALEVAKAGLLFQAKGEAQSILGSAWALQGERMAKVAVADSLDEAKEVFKSPTGKSALALEEAIGKYGSAFKALGVVGVAATTVEEGSYLLDTYKNHPDKIGLATGATVGNIAGDAAFTYGGGVAGAWLGAFFAPVTLGASVPIGAFVGGVVGHLVYDWEVKPFVREGWTGLNPDGG
jgi:hypothetical protein